MFCFQSPLDPFKPIKIFRENDSDEFGAQTISFFFIKKNCRFNSFFALHSAAISVRQLSRSQCGVSHAFRRRHTLWFILIHVCVCACSLFGWIVLVFISFRMLISCVVDFVFTSLQSLTTSTSINRSCQTERKVSGKKTPFCRPKKLRNIYVFVVYRLYTMRWHQRISASFTFTVWSKQKRNLFKHSIKRLAKRYRYFAFICGDRLAWRDAGNHHDQLYFHSWIMLP